MKNIIISSSFALSLILYPSSTMGMNYSSLQESMVSPLQKLMMEPTERCSLPQEDVIFLNQPAEKRKLFNEWNKKIPVTKQLFCDQPDLFAQETTKRSKSWNIFPKNHWKKKKYTHNKKKRKKYYKKRYIKK